MSEIFFAVIYASVSALDVQSVERVLLHYGYEVASVMNRSNEVLVELTYVGQPHGYTIEDELERIHHTFAYRGGVAVKSYAYSGSEYHRYCDEGYTSKAY